MKNEDDSVEGECSEIYETPIFEKEEGLAFPEEIVEEFNGSRFCLQCSSCHGCR